jgi:hypothetical protein
LVFLAAQLALGANLYSEATVSVLVPSSSPSGLNVNDPSVAAALQAAGAVLIPAGFVQGKYLPLSTSGPIAVMTRDISAGSPTVCNVFVRDRRLVFSFAESGIPHSSAVADLCNAVANALRNRFGPATVEVQLK